MKTLVVGGGGREHALIAALARHTPREDLFCAPGNAGTEAIATNLPLKAGQIGGLVDAVEHRDIELTIIGPEAPLVEGLADALRRRGRKVLGPSKAAAQLEGSKIFAKQFMRRHNIPTADFRHFHHLHDAQRYLERARYPVVIKADGLAGGKGVVIVEDEAQGQAVVEDFMSQRRFGAASERIVIETCLTGTEVSVFCLTDGHTLLILPTAQDYKRAYDGDQGPNTGGMGAISPSPALTEEQLIEIERKVLIPTLHGLQIEEAPYSGILYVGLMLTQVGPRVLEYNVRLGDPEAQAILPRLKSDFGELALAAVDGRLDEVDAEWDPRPSVTVVIASEGYPESPKTSRPLKLPATLPGGDRMIFHAGTRRSAGKLRTNGGRVVAVTALGDDLADARAKAYELVGEVELEGMLLRSDIGLPNTED